MSQHDFNIANQTASDARVDINNALAALASTSSGSVEPATKYANQLWYDTASNTLKIRNESNSAWIILGYVGQSSGTFTPNRSAITTSDIDATTLITSGETFSDSNSRIATTAAIIDYVTGLQNGIGVGQTWQNVTNSRSKNTWYQNTTGRPIQLFLIEIWSGNRVDIGPSTTNYVTLDNRDYDSDLDNGTFPIVPVNHYYRSLDSFGQGWFELR